MTLATVDAALAKARARGLDRLDAQLLVAHLLGRTRSWVMAHGDELLHAAESASIETWIARRAEGEPMAYLIGEKEFHGLRLHVDRRVLVPRPDSETLVEWALELLRDLCADEVTQHRVVDLGTGSGALAAAIAHADPKASVVAVDQSEDALAVARANFSRLGLSIECFGSDWWSAIDDRCFDLAIGNPPYIADDDPHLAALRHEPRSALTSGPDGLDDIRRIVTGAPPHIAPGGWLLLEHGHDQADAVRRFLDDMGFDSVQTRRDLSGNERCTGGRRSPERQPATSAGRHTSTGGP